MFAYMEKYFCTLTLKSIARENCSLSFPYCSRITTERKLKMDILPKQRKILKEKNACSLWSCLSYSCGRHRVALLKSPYIMFCNWSGMNLPYNYSFYSATSKTHVSTDTRQLLMVSNFKSMQFLFLKNKFDCCPTNAIQTILDGGRLCSNIIS